MESIVGRCQRAGQFDANCEVVVGLQKRSPRFAMVVSLLLAACQPHGPIAELSFGWVQEIDDLARLEEVFVQQGFQPEMHDYLSEESARESVMPWRYKLDGVTYAYFDYPSRSANNLRAILSLKGSSGRLRVIVHGRRSACPSRGFLKEDQETLELLARRIGDRFKRHGQFRFEKSELC